MAKDDKSKTKEKTKSKAKEIIESIIIAILIAVFIRTFIICAYKIPSESMKPTLLIGDHLLVNKFIYGVKIPLLRKIIIPIREPKRGEIVVFIFPNDRSKDFIKRVIGVGGDKIEIKNKKIFINDQEFKDSYGVFTDSISRPKAMDSRDNFGPVTVPKDSIFVMGDNRDNSMDSRFWGFVGLEDVEGKALILYWSWNRDEKQIFNRLRWQRLGHLLH
jgi:signal peptidase I